MKAFIKALALWIHIHLFPLQDEGVVPWFYRRFILTDEAKAGPVPVIINGNSVVAAGAKLFAQIPGVRVIAIPGMKVNGIRSNMFSFAEPAEPRVYIFDGGGNDFIAGKDPDSVFRDLVNALNEARTALGQQCVIYWINVVPVGPRWPSLAATIAMFNLRVKLSGLVKIVDIHSRLVGEDGFLKAEYRAPDEIHNTPAAYEKEWLPAIKEVVEAHQ